MGWKELHKMVKCCHCSFQENRKRGCIRYVAGVGAKHHQSQASGKLVLSQSIHDILESYPGNLHMSLHLGSLQSKHTIQKQQGKGGKSKSREERRTLANVITCIESWPTIQNWD